MVAGQGRAAHHLTEASDVLLCSTLGHGTGPHSLQLVLVGRTPRRVQSGLSCPAMLPCRGGCCSRQALCAPYLHHSGSQKPAPQQGLLMVGLRRQDSFPESKHSIQILLAWTPPPCVTFRLVVVSLRGRPYLRPRIPALSGGFARGGGGGRGGDAVRAALGGVRVCGWVGGGGGVQRGTGCG